MDEKSIHLPAGTFSSLNQRTTDIFHQLIRSFTTQICFILNSIVQTIISWFQFNRQPKNETTCPIEIHFFHFNRMKKKALQYNDKNGVIDQRSIEYAIVLRSHPFQR